MYLHVLAGSSHHLLIQIDANLIQHLIHQVVCLLLFLISLQAPTTLCDALT